MPTFIDRLGRYSLGFRPGFLPTVVVLCLVPLLVSLGFWQLDRAEQKNHLQTLWQTRQQAVAMSASALTQTADPAFVRVSLQGHFDLGQTFLLDNRTRRGKAGVELLQAFFEESSQRWFLVNRGWIAWPDRTQVPSFSTPQGRINLAAWVSVAEGEPFVLGTQKVELAGLHVINAIRPHQLWANLERIGYRHEVRLEESPFAFDTEWPQTRFNAHKHQGYALQWFSLACALIALFIYFGLYHAREKRHVHRLGRI